jgi:taurine transport system permease protein
MSSADRIPAIARYPRGTAAWRIVARRLRGANAPILGTISVLALVLAWQLTSEHLGSVLFPPPAQALAAWWQMVQDGSLALNVRVSLMRILVGFSAGVVVGVPIGLAMGLFTPAMIVLEPYVQFFRFVPPIAWLVPAILWFGIGETSKGFLIFYATVFLVLVNTMAGVRPWPGCAPCREIRCARREPSSSADGSSSPGSRCRPRSPMC